MCSAAVAEKIKVNPVRVDEILALFAPQWGLDEFVAVNPFWGQRSLPIHEAEAQRLMLGGGQILPADEYLSELAQRCKVKHSPYGIPRLVRTQTAAEYCGSLMQRLFVEAIEAGCSLYCDRGQAAWHIGSQRQQPLIDWWRFFAETDYTFVVASVSPGKGRELIDLLKTRTIGQLLQEHVPTDVAEQFLFAQLQGVKGWCSYLQHRAFEDSKRGEVASIVSEFALIASAYALFLLRAHGCSEKYFDFLRQFSGAPSREMIEYSAARVALLDQIETQERLELSRELSPAEGACSDKKVAAVFCIDVRSERFRRALERVDGGIRTLGFAGFFGLPIQIREQHSTAVVRQLPVLLSASIEAEEKGSQASYVRVGKAMHQAVVRWVRQSIAAGFSYVEAMGFFYLGSMVKQVWHGLRGAPPPRHAEQVFELSIDKHRQAALAAQIIQNAGLLHSNHELIVLCGHTASTCNNPFHAGLTCGACGGHGGLVNASVVASMLNDKEVRMIMAREQGLELSARFVAAVHDTTTDIVQFSGEVPEELRRTFGMATRLCAQERGERLSVSMEPATADVMRRASDWAELQPEWGLAGNAAFIAARRSRTQGGNFEGRAFLHEYDAQQDSNGSVLELIMTAPMVVAHWINMQYFASSAQPHDFGAGTKVLHNVVGQLGVVSGNGGDLLLGLPWQSVADSNGLMHQPRRLTVILEADRTSIERIIEKHQLVRELVKNNWLSLWSLDYQSSHLVRIAV